MIALLKDIQATQGTTMKTFCYDNDGENKAFENPCKQEGLGVSLSTPCLSHSKMAVLNKNF